MGLTARDLMETQVVTVAPEEPLVRVRQLFLEEDIRAAPVVDDEQRVLGVISATDLLRAANEDEEEAREGASYFRDDVELSAWSLADLAEHFEARLGEHTVAEYMTDGVVSVPPDASPAAIARSLRANRVHHVLVVEQGVLRGILSTFDLLGVLERGEAS
jgi:CBS domain-containing protein